jgi:hypothetical protein
MEINTDFNKKVNLTETPELMTEMMQHMDLDSLGSKKD